MTESFANQARRWAEIERENARQPTLKGFTFWLAQHCSVVPGDVMDYTEYLEVAKAFGASQDEVDRSLESSSWP